MYVQVSYEATVSGMKGGHEETYRETSTIRGQLSYTLSEVNIKAVNTE